MELDLELELYTPQITAEASNRIESMLLSTDTQPQETTHAINQDDTVMPQPIEDLPGIENDLVMRGNSSSETREKFRSILAMYSGTEADERPCIPKLSRPRNAHQIIQNVNETLSEFFLQHQSLEDIQTALYCAAMTVIELNGQKIRTRNENSRRNREQVPMWKRMLEKSIDQLRAIHDQISEYLNGNPSRKIKRKINDITRRYQIDLHTRQSNQQLINLKDNLRQRIKVKGARLRRYNEMYKRKRQNNDFYKSRKQFFRALGKTEEVNAESPNDEIDAETFRQFWSSTWSETRPYNQNANWIDKEMKKFQPIPEMRVDGFTKEEVHEAVKKTMNWKAPGPDKIQNFWLKYLPASHEPLAIIFSNALNNPNVLPGHLAKGTTFLIFKKGDKNKPENYRPITCLSVLYKLFTALISNKIYEHCTINNILEEEQKGCVKNALGCKHQLTIDAIVLKQAQVKQRNLHMCFIDYRKAFDSIPHEWLLQILRVYKVCPRIINVLSMLMQNWKINLRLGQREINTVAILRGIFQGDSLSPLWFCLALNPLSTMLKSSKLGYKLKASGEERISHLLFMDDLKIYAESRYKLQSLINITKTFSEDINMSFGYEKCAIIKIIKGNAAPIEEPYQEIEEMAKDDYYKYLGISQNIRINHTRLKAEFTEKYKKKLTKILNTKLTARNMTESINSWAIPSLSYSFGILNWSDTDLHELDRMTRRLLTKFRCLHPNSSVHRLYLPRKEGGRGLLNIYKMCRMFEMKMRNKLLSSHEEILLTARELDDKFTPLNLKNATEGILPNNTQTEDEMYLGMSLHGKYPRALREEHIDKTSSLEWLTDGFLFPETEGFLIAIQDKVIKTNNYEKHCLGADVIDRCRKCGQPGESIEHIMAGCPVLSNSAYLGRHNQLAKIVHQELAKKHNLIETLVPSYKYQPMGVLETGDHILYWDRPMLTDRTIDYNRPDIVLINKRTKTAMVIDIAVPLTANIRKTEAEKITKYENLAIEMKSVWQLEKVTIYPIIISTEGLMSKNLKKNLNLIGVNEKILKTGQKAIILQTCHIVRKFLNC